MSLYLGGIGHFKSIENLVGRVILDQGLHH